MNKSTHEIIQHLVKMRIPHTLKTCSASTSIKVEGGKNYFFSNSGEMVAAKELNFIKKVKAEIIYNAEIKRPKYTDPKYIRFSPNIKSGYLAEFGKIDEIDINAAYWFTALDLGYISESTFNEGLSVSKKCRLMCIGAPAATKDVQYFDGVEYKYIGLEFNEMGRNAFFRIAARVGEIVDLIFDEIRGEAVFYWVDALFVDSRFSDWAVQRFADFGYQTKKIRLARLWCEHTKAGLSVGTIRITGQDEHQTGVEFKRYFKPKNRKKIFKGVEKFI